MKQFMIRLHSVADVEDFVSISTARDYKILVSDGRQTVNGKSFMQMFCLNLTNELDVTAECDDSSFDQLHQEVSRFLAN